jgi:hypothetical protein
MTSRFEVVTLFQKKSLKEIMYFGRIFAPIKILLSTIELERDNFKIKEKNASHHHSMHFCFQSNLLSKNMNFKTFVTLIIFFCPDTAKIKKCDLFQWFSTFFYAKHAFDIKFGLSIIFHEPINKKISRNLLQGGGYFENDYFKFDFENKNF